MSEWQPIDTAPKDGEDILVYSYPDIVSAHWETDVGDDGEPYWALDDGHTRYYALRRHMHEPTHWMPLPTPPATAKDE